MPPNLACEHPKLDKFTQILKEKRAHKGMTIEKARNLLADDYPYFAAMLVDQGEADGLVSGATTDEDLLRAGLTSLRFLTNLELQVLEAIRKDGSRLSP